MSEATEVIDGEQVKVIRTEALTAPGSQVVADITNQTERGLALFRERARVAREQLKIALTLTQPGQWALYGEGDKIGVYATSGAADRILRMGYGMRWGPKTVTIDTTDKAIVATCKANLLLHTGEVYEEFTGTRRAVLDTEREGGVRGYLKDEQSIAKGAIANMMHTALTTLLGLRFLTLADFKELGFDLSKITRRVDFQDHAEEQGAGDTPRVPYGKNKGKAITELEDKSLSWYIDASAKAIADPEKAKWKSKEEKWHKALCAERERRLGTPAKKPAEKTPANPAPDPAKMPDFDEPPPADEPGSNG